MPTARVLVVEHNDALCHLFYHSLLRSGFATMSVSAGKQTPDLVKSFRPDILLIDLDLPDVNGLDLIRSIKAQLGKQAPIVIAFSTHDRFYYHTAQELDYFFFKPVSVITLNDFVRRVSGRLAARHSS
ncbi:MAG: response regulator transcription factor [Anaerolineae bacterium]|nr:response regulator transcription factor [Anaerolineae bacterium]